MSQGFTFGFSNDDAEVSEADIAMAEDEAPADSETNASLIPPALHSFDEILASLPSALSYTFTSAPIRLPRRELFDIRAQLMTEADPSRDVAIGLNAEDIEPGVYEGGFKTWECAVDLARFVLGAIDSGGLNCDGRSVHTIELGAGTALPSATLLHHLLTRPLSTTSASPAPPLSLTVADYNHSVLSLATGPNLFLTSLAALDLLLPDIDGAHADLEPSSTLLATLRAALHRRNVSITFLSGVWGLDFADAALKHAPDSPNKPLTLVLASETIYQPTSLPAFVDTLLALMQATRTNGGETRAYVAAKRVYFGVGGGVQEFRAHVEAKGASVKECWGSENEPGTGKGVGRCILEVEL